MICWRCGKDNKETSKACKQCGVDLRLPPLWRPTWQWHMKTIAIIYIALIFIYIVGMAVVKKLPPPYNQRTIPAEMTPWLHKGSNQ